MSRPEDTRFRTLELHGWRQYREVSLTFHPRLTVLTGANGSGKTTILALLARHFDWSSALLAVPRRKFGRGGLYSTGLRGFLDAATGQAPIGSLTYSNGSKTDITVPIEGAAPQYQLTWQQGMQRVNGLYLTSHRAIAAYQQVQTVPARFSESETLLNQFINEVRSRYLGGHTGRSAATQMKESLIAAAIYGEGNSSVQRNEEAHAVWFGFQEALHRLLPAEIGFERMSIREAEVILETTTGDFPLDSVSGGISAVVELAWQVFLRSRRSPEFTVCIDEPENHLHPSLQRFLLTRLLEAFPSISFIVATHSPFIVTSVPESNVYVFEFVDGEIETYLLDQVNKAASADETLRRVLGLESTLPLWAERQFNAAVADSLERPLSGETVRELRQQLDRLGLGDQFPAAAEAIVEQARREEANEGP